MLYAIRETSAENNRGITRGLSLTHKFFFITFCYILITFGYIALHLAYFTHSLFTHSLITFGYMKNACKLLILLKIELCTYAQFRGTMELYYGGRLC